ncbi:MAG TPA: ROK family protein [Pseudonocardiaceae bacterium]
MTTAPGLGTRPDDVRRHNRAALLRRLHVHGPSTRAELATELGLNRSTIKALVDGLAEDGLVAEKSPAQRSGVGRPSLLVLPQAQAAVVLAVDIQVEQVALALVGIGGEILGRARARLGRDTGEPREVFTKIIDVAVPLIEELGVEVAAVGVSVPGVVRHEDGFVHELPNLRWTDVPLGAWLSHALRVPVHIGNDGELGGLAEFLRGAARGTANVVYISADVGIGGGAIAGGTSLSGAGGHHIGEVGHMVVRPDGRPCYCGSRGCWETEVGEHALCRALGLPETTTRGAIVAELRGIAGNTTEVLVRLSEFGEWLALGLCNLSNLLSPELLVLGDLFTALPPALVEHVQRLVRERSLVSRALGGVRVVTAALGADAKLLGAAELAFEPVLGG